MDWEFVTRFFRRKGMMSLEEAFETEERLLKAVSVLSGSINQKVEQIDDQGISDQCIELHACYAKLSEEGNIEALKRAFFIQWYSANEAGFVTGIPMGWTGDSEIKFGSSKRLSSDSEKAVFMKMNDLLESGMIDEEFVGILNWCFRIGDFYFEHFDYNKKLVENIRKLPANDSLPENIDKKNYAGRGYLGDYFTAISKHT